MTPLNGVADIAQAAVAFAMLYGQAVPTTTANAALTGNPQSLVTTAVAMFGPGQSPVVAICNLAETLYAFRSDVPTGAARNATLTLCGQAAKFADGNGFGLMAGGRGDAICSAMQRELGETPPAGTSWPATSADPAVASQFLAPTPVVAPPMTPPAS